MQIALCVLLLCVGLAVGARLSGKPKHVRSIQDEVSANIINVINTIRTGTSIERSRTPENRSLVQLDQEELLTKDQCEGLPQDCWQRQAYENVKCILLAKDVAAKRFPCIYATAGYKCNEQRYIFMYSEDSNDPRNLRLVANAMREYLPQSYSFGPNTSLVISYPPSECQRSVDDYREMFWDLLKNLRSYDQKPWPENIPTETAAAKWTFCFDGVPWFLAAMTPAHEQRRSRAAPNFTIAVQPKWVFDNLFRTPEKRRAAVQAVRKLMPAYDNIEASPDLSAYGTEGTTEAHQYYLLDENKTAYCPYNDLNA